MSRPAEDAGAAPADLAALRLLAGLAPELAGRLRAVGYTAAGLAGLLGADGLAALDRAEPAAVARAVDRAAAAGAAPDLIAAVRGLILEQPADLAGALGAGLRDRLLGAGLLEAHPGGQRARVDLRPVRIADAERLVFSDRDASMRPRVPGRDHVPGVGRASRSLLDITPVDPVGSVLDLGAGCGVQALGQLGAGALTLTDVSERANLLARATMAANGRADAEVLAGGWFDPVAGRRFDRIVANPPFVVGPATVGHVYRDSGLDLDGATETLLSGVAGHLTDSGSAHLLGSWVHPADGDWAARVASWIPAEGAAAWVVQRDAVDPAAYVGTWLRDEGVDPRSAEGRRRGREWLDHLAAGGVAAVGFGYVTVHRIDGPSTVTCEEAAQRMAGAFRGEAVEHRLRERWLAEAGAEGVAAARFRLRPGVALERVGLADAGAGQGFAPAALRLTRTDGPRWSHDIDEPVAALLGALHPQAPLRLTVELLHGFGAFGDADPGAVLAAAVPVVADLVRHGMVLPEELLAPDAGPPTREE